MKDYDSRTQQNFMLAIYAIVALKTEYPIGSLNRCKDINGMDKQEFCKQATLFMSLRRNNPQYERWLMTGGKFPRPQGLNALNCGEKSRLALQKIQQVFTDMPEYKKRAIELVSLVTTSDQDTHEMVVIDRAIGSDPKNIETWGERAVICDTWAMKFYLAKNFKKEQMHGKKIDILTPNITIRSDYLKGHPQIVPCPQGISPFPTTHLAMRVKR